jgi:hypothetical protein
VRFEVFTAVRMILFWIYTAPKPRRTISSKLPLFLNPNLEDMEVNLHAF